ncbi:MAG: hypothetical protein IKY82_03860 [Alistipes sp.]|nr:hypothetical protein [Alistipes sp.]
MKTKVIIPIYRIPTPDEMCAMRNNCRILAAYDIAVLAPEGLDLSDTQRELGEEVEFIYVSDKWLGKRNGIAGYNRMMMSEEFYAMFSEWDYILICHSDAWIFSDSLQAWSDKGYDCVAAPWVRRRVYDLPLIKQYMSLRAWMRHRKGLKCRADLYGRIGNGGLSLRRVESFRTACRKYADRIEEYMRGGSHLYNEDVFWATEPQEFRYPAWREALEFAIDTNPAYCYRLLGHLPMGCHSWTKPKMWRFWKEIIKKA